MEQHQNYTREVAEHQEEALSKIVAKVTRGSLVLDIGCGAGMLGRYLAENKECVVDGVDIDPQALDLARAKYRKVGVFNLEHDSLVKTFPAEAYDCIVMADVIEHIVNPEQLFEDVKKLLKPDGVLLFSIPNVTHLAAGLELVLGKFDYQNNGLLDATHVRFYSRESFTKKLAANGIYVQEVDAVKRDIDQTEFAGFSHFPKNWIEQITAFREDALTYQWIITARLFKPSLTAPKNLAKLGVTQKYLNLNSRLYWRSAFEHGFSEKNSIPGCMTIDESGFHKVIFDFSDVNCSYPVIDIRIDPVNDKTNFIFEGAWLISHDQKLVWSTDELEKEDLFNANLVEFAKSRSFVVCPSSDDPQWNLKIAESAVAQIQPGFKFHLGLNVSTDLIFSTMVGALEEERTKHSDKSSAQEISLATKDAEITKLKVLEKKNAQHIDATDFELARLKVATDDLIGELSDRDTDILLLKNTLDEKSLKESVLFGELQAQKNASNEFAEQVATKLSESRADILHLESMLDEKSLKETILFGELQAQKEAANECAAQTATKLTEYQSHIFALQTKLESQTNIVEAARVQIKSLETLLAERGRQLGRAEQHYARTLETLSWRITKPLRWLRRKIS